MYLNSQNKYYLDKKGFTLIELLSVIIIIGVLAYMLIYSPLKSGVNITDYVKQIFNQ